MKSIYLAWNREIVKLDVGWDNLDYAIDQLLYECKKQ